MEEGHQGASVDEGWSLGAGDGGEGGCQVVVHRELADGRAVRHARTAHPQGNSDVFLVGGLFPGRKSVLSEVEAVVGP